MASQRKRHLFLGLGLAVALALAVSPASASAVSTLTGETLNGSGSAAQSGLCTSPDVSGTAAGPYPGTFTETGIFNRVTGDFSATFTITSANTTVTGSKTNLSSGSVGCNAGPVNGAPVSYTATIHTPSGNFQDEGTSVVIVVGGGATETTLTETFTSSLPQPTSKDQCKNNGWKNFPQFKNQGECVSSVVSKSQT